MQNYLPASSNYYALTPTSSDQSSYPTPPSNYFVNNSFTSTQNVQDLNHQFNQQNFINSDFSIQPHQYFLQNQSFVSDPLLSTQYCSTNDDFMSKSSNPVIMSPDSICSQTPIFDSTLLSSKNCSNFVANNPSNLVMLSPESICSKTQNAVDLILPASSSNSNNFICTPASSSSSGAVLSPESTSGQVSSKIGTAFLSTAQSNNFVSNSTDVKVHYSQNYPNYNLQFQNVANTEFNIPILQNVNYDTNLPYSEQIQYLHPQYDNIVYNHVVSNQYSEY